MSLAVSHSIRACACTCCAVVDTIDDPITTSSRDFSACSTQVLTCGCMPYGQMQQQYGGGKFQKQGPFCIWNLCCTVLCPYACASACKSICVAVLLNDHHSLPRVAAASRTSTPSPAHSNKTESKNPPLCLVLWRARFQAHAHVTTGGMCVISVCS